MVIFFSGTFFHRATLLSKRKGFDTNQPSVSDTDNPLEVKPLICNCVVEIVQATLGTFIGTDLNPGGRFIDTQQFIRGIIGEHIRQAQRP